MLNTVKNSLLFFSAALILFSGCGQKPDPNFEASADQFENTYDIKFSNSSQNAETYLWQFGDGEESREENPVHVYKVPGNYEVKLTAYAKSGKKEKTSSRNLQIGNVLDHYIGEYKGTQVDITPGGTHYLDTTQLDSVQVIWSDDNTVALSRFNIMVKGNSFYVMHGYDSLIDPQGNQQIIEFIYGGPFSYTEGKLNFELNTKLTTYHPSGPELLDLKYDVKLNRK